MRGGANSAPPPKKHTCRAFFGKIFSQSKPSTHTCMMQKEYFQKSHRKYAKMGKKWGHKKQLIDLAESAPPPIRSKVPEHKIIFAIFILRKYGLFCKYSFCIMHVSV